LLVFVFSIELSPLLEPPDDCAMTIDAAVIEQFGQPPPGIDLSEVQMPGTEIGVIALVAVATLSVLLRLGSRLVQDAGLRADDYLIIIALVFSIGTCVLTVESTSLVLSTTRLAIKFTMLTKLRTQCPPQAPEDMSGLWGQNKW
jgi:hypothetical protein